MLQILEHYGLMEKMRRSGDRISGSCPIHKGKNQTAFRVSVEKNCWNCFSDCKCGGNILDFVSRMENCDVLDAALLIKGWFKLTFPEREDERSERREESRPPQRKAEAPKKDEKPAEPETGENAPLKFALSHLQPEHPYLNERGLTAETIATFGLGFCQKGIMAGHVAIPIHNARGELVAYAGRFPGEPPNPDEKYKLPKGFKKSLEVFNLHRASQISTERPLIVVEGFFGCMKLWQSGVQRVVSLMGSTLCEPQAEHISKLLSHEQRVILLFDEDDFLEGGAQPISMRVIGDGATVARLVAGEIRRIGNDQVDARAWHGAHHVDAIAVNDLVQNGCVQSVAPFFGLV